MFNLSLEQSDKQIVDMITEGSEHSLEKFLPKVKSGFRRLQKKVFLRLE